MRRHSVDVVPLVLLRKTPNEGPDAGSYTTMRLARAGMAVRFVTCWIRPPGWRRSKGCPLSQRADVAPALRAHLTPTCNFSRVHVAPPQASSREYRGVVKAQASSISDTLVPDSTGWRPKTRVTRCLIHHSAPDPGSFSARRWFPPCADGCCRCSDMCRAFQSGRKSSRWYPEPRSGTGRSRSLPSAAHRPDLSR